MALIKCPECSNDVSDKAEKCPKCGYGQMYYSVMQTRSADEGSTVFYECIKCHYKYNQNN